MKFSNIANVVDTEHDNGRLIEIGVTTVSIPEKKILKSYCMPIKVDFDISPEITQLTGWTRAKLERQGIEKEEAVRLLLNRYGFTNRLLVTDMSTEINFLEETFNLTFSPHRLNVSILYALNTSKNNKEGLEEMLAEYGMQFEGRPHKGVDDSRNIARLFLRLLADLYRPLMKMTECVRGETQE